MQRVEQDGPWSLFDPKVVPNFPDLYGEAFENAYCDAERQQKYVKQVRARDLYARMMRTLAETGNGWMVFKDACNLKCNQTGASGNVVHLSNLCTEITEVTSSSEIAVCNLGSINLAGTSLTARSASISLQRRYVKLFPCLTGSLISITTR
jgi:ribonucleoside-diphosphate reductase alpha chain